ncbi:hypothetical protein AMTRI_Chr12g240860 [Amborella trichopoda]|uniref:WLM domain-containing protein n=1 Tax=Amborella trichopoda TaxID=13333 RepID=W1PHS9_AMBTC|nr:DNA-dependent metalloprotease WSS1 [Amborella trichopoda]ERN07254.1 hypothetical protein AMTR_s00019p00196420 [Amborella trichopoda]|eukprot:XP_006845579.1 DNA-dependent metalloprotease WSS1 [Amborella trichopoda]
MELGDLYKVWEIKVLKKPGEEDARKFLEKVAKQVQPIMRKHKWRVKLLSEFCPKNLLGLNVGGGVEVRLRLRKPNREWEFLSFEEVLDTMLHELCHNVHGPHNADFYKLWDGLRQECDELMAKGITGSGQGFDLPGKRLGGFSRNPPLPALRQTALAAAEKRARLEALLPSGPKRLGGDGDIMSALSPIQAAAMAAERRLQDDLWCGSVNSVEANDDNSLGQPVGFSKVDYGNKNGVSHDSHSNGKVGISGSSELPSSSSGEGLRSKPPPISQLKDSREEAPIWECGACTLFNQPLALLCEACGSQRPRDTGVKYKIWSCKFCTLENEVRLDKCLACGQWRYSYGPPVFTPAPNVGT